LASVGDKNGAYSKISNLNAQRSLLLFDEDLYIQSAELEVELQVRINSQGMREPQHLTIKVPLKGSPVDELREYDIGD
jgi:hypothetical protein